MYCKHCGKTIEDDSTFCKYCGRDVVETTLKKGTCTDVPDNGRQETKKEGHANRRNVKNKTKFWILLILLLCVVGCGGYYAFTKIFKGYDKDAIVELTPEFIKAVQEYQRLDSFSEGLAAVMDNYKWGYINTKGEEVIPCQFQSASPFSEGLAAVIKDDAWGYIDTEGDVVIPFEIKAEAVGRFSEGLAFIYHDESNFSIIDKTGNTIFSGNSDFSCFFGPEVQNDFLPTFYKGKIYVPIECDKYAVYDKKGKIEKEVNQDTKDKLDRREENKTYNIISKQNGDNDDLHWYTVGLKDDDDNEVVPPIFDGFGDVNMGGKIAASNGVVLVVLDELGDDVVEGPGDELSSSDTKSYYGYADLKGNNTFSKETKRICRESKERAVQTLLQKRADEMLRLYKEGPDWLQGAWVLELTDDYGRHLGYMYEVFNHGKAKSYLDNFLVTEREYVVNENMVTFDSGHYVLDKNRLIIIAANGQEFRQISTNPNFTPQ